MRSVVAGLLGTVSIVGCTTGPIQTNNPNPPSVSWTIKDQVTGATQNLTPAGSLVTGFLTPGDDYLVVFRTASPSGIKSITFGATGQVICSNNRGQYTEGHPYNHSIPSQTIDLSVLPGNQVYTQGFFPYIFSWNTGAAKDAIAACGADIPLLGTTSYTGEAATYSGVSSGSTGLNVTTCPSGSCGG